MSQRSCGDFFEELPLRGTEGQNDKKPGGGFTLIVIVLVWTFLSRLILMFVSLSAIEDREEGEVVDAEEVKDTAGTKVTGINTT